MDKDYKKPLDLPEVTRQEAEKAGCFSTNPNKIVGDITVELLGATPMSVTPAELEEELGGALTPEEVIALLQNLVSKELPKLEDMKTNADEVWEKNKSGIGRGHAMDGLPLVAFLIHGSKMLDSALTGVVYSRSLATSSRRKDTTISDLYIPQSIASNPELYRAYRETNQYCLDCKTEITNTFGKEYFNKLRPYNEPCDILYVVPLSSLVLLATECENDKQGLLPVELHTFVERLPALLKKVGLYNAFILRMLVPRAGYKHYHVFTDPDYCWYHRRSFEVSLDPSAKKHSELHSTCKHDNGVPDDQVKKKLSALLEGERAQLGSLMNYTPAEHLQACRRMAYARWELATAFNHAYTLSFESSISWRVWSEQKRHGTLNQRVQSVYYAALEAVEKLTSVWVGGRTAALSSEQRRTIAKIFAINEATDKSFDWLYNKDANKYDTPLNILVSYLCLFTRMLTNNIPLRDALYCMPRMLRLHTWEYYDLLNIMCLELPLRLCTTCEAERLASSREKEQALHEIPVFNMSNGTATAIGPKCSVGMCTEQKFCKNILKYVPNYTQERHNQLRDLLDQYRDKPIHATAK